MLGIAPVSHGSLSSGGGAMPESEEPGVHGKLGPHLELLDRMVEDQPRWVRMGVVDQRYHYGYSVQPTPSFAPWMKGRF